MFRLITATASLAFLALTTANQAVAQLPCGNRSDFIKVLADKYQETSKALGIANQTNLVEVFTSPNGTWTIMVTQPRGKTCIIAAGNSWEDLPPTKNLTSL